MSEEALAIGVSLLIVGFGFNTVSPYVEANVGGWGILFALLGLVIIGVRLRAMLSA